MTTEWISASSQVSYACTSDYRRNTMHSAPYYIRKVREHVEIPRALACVPVCGYVCVCVCTCARACVCVCGSKKTVGVGRPIWCWESADPPPGSAAGKHSEFSLIRKGRLRPIFLAFSVIVVRILFFQFFPFLFQTFFRKTKETILMKYVLNFYYTLKICWVFS